MGGVPKPLEERVIFMPRNIPPSDQTLEVIGCCNPGATLFKKNDKDNVYLLVRIIEKRKESEAFLKHLGSPRAKIDGKEYEVIWEYEREDRDAKYNSPHSLKTTEFEEIVKPTTISHLRLAESEDGINFKISDKPSFFPQTAYEEYGVEDARITMFNEEINLGKNSYKNIFTYVACSKDYDVCTAFCATNDFNDFIRLPESNPNIIFLAPSKDVVLFPKKFLNSRTETEEFLALTRPNSTSGYMVPSIFLSYSSDLFHWGDHRLLIKGDEKGHVGAGPAPIELEEGWLIIDHQHRHLKDGSKEYVGRAFLIDKQNPFKILKKSEELLEPHLEISCEPVVNNVTFPSGAILKDDKLYIYTGENDAVVAVHIYNLGNFMDFLKVV